MKKIKLMVGLCCYGNVHPMFMLSLMELLQLAGGRLHVVTNDSLVSRARNRVAAEFLASDCDTLLQIDTDIAFDPKDMLKMLQRDLPIVGGMYALKRVEQRWCMNKLKGKRIKKDGTFQVKYLGTGMLSVKREVFEKMISFKVAKEYSSDDNEKNMKRWDFFQNGVAYDKELKRDRYLSEDWYFCETAIKLGYKIIADTKNVGRHYGEACYPLNINGADDKA